MDVLSLGLVQQQSRGWPGGDEAWGERMRRCNRAGKGDWCLQRMNWREKRLNWRETVAIAIATSGRSAACRRATGYCWRKHARGIVRVQAAAVLVMASLSSWEYYWNCCCCRTKKKKKETEKTSARVNGNDDDDREEE